MSERPGQTVPRSPAPTELVLAAVLMTVSSSFGQTYFIGIFAPWLKGELELSNGAFGGFYALGTVASACVLIWGGKVADHFRIRWLAVAALAGLATMCVAMAANHSALLLLPILFGLRLFGQGSLGHLAITGTGRWYMRRRGRMMSIAVLGFPIGEALMPMTAVMLISVVGWRETWLAAAAALCFVSVPLVLLFLRREPSHDQVVDRTSEPQAPRRHWTRREVLRTPVFFAVLSGVLAPSFVMTGIFFHQAHLVEVKGWTLAWFAGWFPLFAGVSVAAALATGWLVDRFDARRLLPFFLLPMALGVAVLAMWDSEMAVPVFMAVGAVTSGSASTLLGALWAELFGTRHLGSIRSIAFAGQVFASALSPGLIGLLLDAGVHLELQYLAMMTYALLSAFWLRLILPRLRRLETVSSLGS